MVEAPPRQPLYHSPWGLLDFQALGCAYCYERLNNLAVWDTGIGKSHLAMATACLLFEDDLIDIVLLIAEKDKLMPDEWPRDFATYTDLTVGIYHKISPTKRAQMRENLPRVLLSTYETIRNDAARLVEVVKAKGKKTKKLVAGELTEALRGKRVLIVYDEMPKLANRGSGLHKAHALMIDDLGKFGEVRILGLTATPFRRDPEGYYNLGRLVTPQTVGTVASFEKDHIAARDIFGKPSRFKNLDARECEPGVVPFAEKMRPVLLRKRKTDPDVIEQFPKTNEEPPRYVHLGDRHQEFYLAVEALSDDCDEWAQRQFFMLMRQIAGHPMSLLRSDGKIARSIASEVGEAGLRSLGSAKLDRLVTDLVPIVHGQGALVVVFTFFANTILPILWEGLEEAGISVAPNAPFLSDRDRALFKQEFKAGKRQVFLSSDAGAKGINLPEATYCFEYESALTHENRTQRLNRIHRIDSPHQLVTFRTYVAYDTVEEPIVHGVLQGNDWSDRLLEDDDLGDDFITADQRREMLRIARRRASLSKSA